MLRILYVTDSLMAGGIESQLVDLILRLDRSRFDPQVICLYGPTARDLHFAPELEAAGVRIHTLDLGWSASDKVQGVRQIIKVARTIRPYFIQAENYHANLLTRLARPFFPATQLIGTTRGVLTPKQLRYERLGARCCSHIVASAPFLKDMLKMSAGVPERKITVVPNAVDVDRFSTSDNPQLRTQIALGINRVFVSIGRISSQKTMHLIPQALGILKRQGSLPTNFRIFIVGPVQDQPMQALLDAAIRQDELHPWIIQHKATSVPNDYYHAADVSILFSRLEGIPIVALESLAAGRPVIISEEANAAGVIEHGKTGWIVRTGDIAHLAETLQRVLRLTDAELLGMRQFCIARAQEYSLETLVQTYSRLYETWSTSAPAIP